MSKMTVLPFSSEHGLNQIMENVKQNLYAFGYEANSVLLSPKVAVLTVKKDRDGFKNILGMGVESRATVSVVDDKVLIANIENEWSNKALAIAIGWFFCLIPFITGLVGTFSQIGLASKVAEAFTYGCTPGGNQARFQQPPYGGQPQYQQPYQQQPYQQQPQQYQAPKQ